MHGHGFRPLCRATEIQRLIGRTENGRYLRVIYVPDPEPDSAFVITAYDLKGKPLVAYRSRRKGKGRR